MMMIINNIMMYRYVPLPLYAFPIYTEWVNIIIKEWWNVVDGQKLNWREYFFVKEWASSFYWARQRKKRRMLKVVLVLNEAFSFLWKSRRSNATAIGLIFQEWLFTTKLYYTSIYFYVFFSLGLMYICTKFCTPYRPPPPLHSFVLHSFGIEQFLVW